MKNLAPLISSSLLMSFIAFPAFSHQFAPQHGLHDDPNHLHEETTLVKTTKKKYIKLSPSPEEASLQSQQTKSDDNTQFRTLTLGYSELRFPNENDHEDPLTIDALSLGFSYTKFSYQPQQEKFNLGLNIAANLSYGKEKQQESFLNNNLELKKDKHIFLASLLLSPVVAYHFSDQFTVYAKGGANVSYLNIKATVSDFYIPYPTKESISNVTLGYIYGGGLTYTFSDQSTIGLEYQFKSAKHKPKNNREEFTLESQNVYLTFGKQF